MLTEQQLHGVYVPVVTPFDAQENLDLESLHQLVATIAKNDVQGIVLNGTTGESPSTSKEEIEQMMATVQRALAGTNIPLVLGAGSNDTRSTVSRIEQAGALGAEAVLVVVPYYNRPSQQGVIEHFRKAAQVGVPVILYEIPHRTGLKLEHDTVRQILDIDGVIGMKDSTPNTDLVTALVQGGQTKPILCGEDTLLYPSLTAGAKGMMSATANVHTDRFVAFYQAFTSGQHADAEAQFNALLPLIRLAFAEPNPAPLKWLLHEQGIIEHGTLRLPMLPISPALRERLLPFVQQLQV
ncbi:4-hydroxy-tetrahydrodipicolinate synthase [Paenibacillus guangzhouensis]|uniref:4-hydroxy-tetrahydrodipicolinate synthase n=1 Tax=Paenibacillus guangzhouensis TaxID=1473112 RepID=UPI0012671439|nr:4-hydroxy-tetrahydrodipicolinate synthase [Paenibacillus guangzhouensis]